MGEKANTLQLLYDFHVLDEILPGYSALYGHEQKTPWHIYDVFQHTDIAFMIGANLLVKALMITALRITKSMLMSVNKSHMSK